MLIINATLITWEASNRILNDHAVYIKGSHIRAIVPKVWERYQKEVAKVL